MDFFAQIIDFILHMEKYLDHPSGGRQLDVCNLWVVIFIETGLVVTPFLPGDSLLCCRGICRPRAF